MFPHPATAVPIPVSMGHQVAIFFSDTSIPIPTSQIDIFASSSSGPI
jgi:hypothetical protein